MCATWCVHFLIDRQVFFRLFSVAPRTLLHVQAFDAGGGNSCPKCECRCHGNPCKDVCPAANISVFARSITRSSFVRLNFYNARLAAVSLAYGWINRVCDCLFADNNIALHAWDQANNIDITGCNFYGNQIAVLAEEAGQVQISGNCMEGGQGPAIIASSIYGLTVSSNYFESNNMCGPGAR